MMYVGVTVTYRLHNNLKRTIFYSQLVVSTSKIFRETTIIKWLLHSIQNRNDYNIFTEQLIVSKVRQRDKS